MLKTVLQAFNLDADSAVKPFGSGLINHTWMVEDRGLRYILQRINKNIFKSPQAIAGNLSLLQDYFKTVAPGYLFVAPLPARNGALMVEDEGEFYRLSPFVDHSRTINAIEHAGEAYQAAQQFGRFTRLLNNFDPQKLSYTLPDFHNLNLRFQQFKAAAADTDAGRLTGAAAEINQVHALADIASIYQQLIADRQIPVRVIHHDTKINNVLFTDAGQGLAVIDLDTVMPGYFISDVGDMMRTYLSPVSEEERNLSLIKINPDYFAAIYRGYMSEMKDVLTAAERDLFLYSGKFMIYMQALRFLTDFLNSDVYYYTTYSGQNLMRARNQLTLLKEYIACEEGFKALMNDMEAAGS